jgi:signal transduction histidine kinase
MQSRIFDPLFTTKGEKGTGLGLPQVCTFMQAMHGHVSFVSEAGHGTTFDLWFPSSFSEKADDTK